MLQNGPIEERGDYHYWTKQTRHLSSADHKTVPTPQEACTQIGCNIPSPRQFSAYKTKTPSNDTKHTAFTQAPSGALWYLQLAHWVSHCSRSAANQWAQRMHSTFFKRYVMLKMCWERTGKWELKNKRGLKSYRCSRSWNPYEDYQSHGHMVKRLLPQLHMYPTQDAKPANSVHHRTTRASLLLLLSLSCY